MSRRRRTIADTRGNGNTSFGTPPPLFGGSPSPAKKKTHNYTVEIKPSDGEIDAPMVNELRERILALKVGHVVWKKESVAAKENAFGEVRQLAIVTSCIAVFVVVVVR